MGIPGGADGAEKNQWRGLHQKKIDDIISQIAKGLVFLHGKGIIHRDLKPSNILIGPNNAVMLADFGLTRRLLSGEDTYCSPEQSSGRQITTASDIYSLGVVWHELLTGRTEVGYLPPGKRLRKNCSPEYSGLVTSCLLGQPADRPKAEAFAQDDIEGKAEAEATPKPKAKPKAKLKAKPNLKLKPKAKRKREAKPEDKTTPKAKQPEIDTSDAWWLWLYFLLFLVGFFFVLKGCISS